MVEVRGKNYSLTTIKNYCRLLGFFPYDLIQVGDKLSIKFCLKYLVWTYFLVSSLVISGTIGTFLSLMSVKSWFSPSYVNALMVVYIVHLNFMFNILSGVICITYTTFSRRSLKDFINNIVKADILLDQLKIPIRKNRWSKPMAIVVVLLIVVIFISDAAAHYLVLDENAFNMHVLRKIPYYGSYFFTVGQTYTFWNLVLLIRARLFAIKIALTLSDDNLKSEKKIIVQEFMSVLVQQINTGKHNFKRLQEVYISLFDAAKAIDELVRPFIVLSIAIRFFSLLLAPFIMYVQLIGYKDNIFIVSQTLWAIGQVSLLALIIEPACSCRQKYEELRQELSKLLCYETMFKGELNLLFDLVRALPIEFHINDATPLKRILYISILGSLTTYLVVLFQMNMI